MTVSRVDDITVIKLTDSEITDAMYVQQLEEELLEILEDAEPPKLLIDFGEVKLLSSRMLGALIRLQKRCAERGGWVRFCSIRRSILHILELTNLDKVFEIYPNAEEALSKA